MKYEGSVHFVEDKTMMVHFNDFLPTTHVLPTRILARIFELHLRRHQQLRVSINYFTVAETVQASTLGLGYSHFEQIFLKFEFLLSSPKKLLLIARVVFLGGVVAKS